MMIMFVNGKDFSKNTNSVATKHGKNSSHFDSFLLVLKDFNLPRFSAGSFLRRSKRLSHRFALKRETGFEEKTCLLYLTSIMRNVDVDPTNEVIDTYKILT